MAEEYKKCVRRTSFIETIPNWTCSKPSRPIGAEVACLRRYFIAPLAACILFLLIGCGTRQITSLPIQQLDEPAKPTMSKSKKALPKAQTEAEDDLPGRPEVRPPAVSGVWYPNDPEELKRAVHNYLASAKAQRKGEMPAALIVPHAGWKFCGHIAAEAYKVIEGFDFDTVVLVGPSHYFPVQGAAVPTAKAFLTPIGKVEVDIELAEKLIKQCRLVYRNSLAHDREHCIESQLPFLQVILSKTSWKLLPITTGEMSAEQCKVLGIALANLIAGKRALLIASSDMSHYPKYEDAKQADEEMLKAMETLSTDKILATNERLLRSRIRNLECTLCGMSAVLSVIEAAKALRTSARLEILRYANSGDVPNGDKSKVVGYVAACIYGKPSETRSISLGRLREPSLHEAYIRPQLSDMACKELLRIVKIAVRSAVKDGKKPIVQVNSRELLEPWGVFVTLKKDGELRGCIGIIEPIKPLWENAIDAAISAALHDRRFTPVKFDELDKLDVEVTVLGRLEEIVSLREIELGRHGLVVIDGEHSGLLLPQVAAEFKWNRVQFVEATCEKAGLSKDAWKEGAFVFRFDAQVIK
ncbi:MAG: AmmeMemoRadiSam system protein B [Armatimonadota bacterium]|nr:AmmeMemoRadiSam system protein B [Armatimonadota bacterium]MCX7776826.1 AmmeMemoRadiSam system protein B [Armatimonadota bacterium]MDW8024621.1 AmmeMemoRadiSam system protein B [Armatimonadota bacterium]